VLTVDHGLRAAAADEARQVAGWAAALGLEHHTLVWSGEKPKSGIQARARAARYALMTDWCRDHGVPLLLTGHTMDDQAETVAMRLARTSTAASLAGVWPERDWNGVTLWRPLLGFRREELRRYLVECQQEWIEDPSNEQERFERVRVRRKLRSQAKDEVPELAAMAVEAIRQVGEIESAVRNFEERYVEWRAEGYGVVDRRAFARLPAEEQKAVIAMLLKVLAGTRAAPHSLVSIASWAGGGGVRRRSLGGVLFALRDSCLIVGREPGRIPQQPVEVPAAGALLWDGRFWVECEPGSLIRPAGSSSPAQLAGKAVPRFVRDGWPLALDPQGQPVAANVKFKPCLG
jgi:tRNA(Ile)-lysidine synthase